MAYFRNFTVISLLFELNIAESSGIFLMILLVRSTELCQREEIVFWSIEYNKRKPKICLCSQAQEISDKSSWI